jgi:alkylation response protein AidB-like acyl-CoA dehydrogenase
VDFSFSEEQEAIRGLAQQILEAEVTPERLKEVGAGTERFDRRTWEELAKANLLGLSLPADAGGSGLGFVETCLVLEQVGRTVALVPVLPTVVLGALPIAEFGTAEQRRAWLPGVVSGATVLTAGLVEVGAAAERPVTKARRAPDGGWVLDGEKICVPFAAVAEAILVPATTGDAGEVGVFIVRPGSTGVSLDALETTSGQPESRLTLSGVTVVDGDVLGDPRRGAAIVDWVLARATAAMCVTAIGVCAEALRLTADYTKTRVQFDKPIATFQAVGQRAADAYIDTEAVRLTAWQAAWRLAEGRPAAAEIAIAKFWAAEGGQRVVHAAQHLHGGMGVDRDYPLHRYFLWAKQLELTLGGSTAQLLRLGAMMVDEPVVA